jgi:hypothetical protein
MNKADYIHLFKEACGGRCNAEYNPCAFRQAADSLAALKPVAWVYVNDDGECEQIDYGEAWNDPDVQPLYSFGKNNENAALP